MNTGIFLKVLLEQFPHTPTTTQEAVLGQLADFIFSKEKNEVFMLKGFAGTGKTTIIGTLVNQLWQTKRKSVLLAPTGRAAKVISNYSGRGAHTIHRHIYFPKRDKSGGMKFVLAPNKHKNTIFIVDEASMIPDTATDSKIFENGSLLDDLLMYVYSGHQCKLILIGDTAQLPPVNLTLSPALNENTLALNYNKEVKTMELDEVVRQQLDSGILLNATNLREQLAAEFVDEFRFDVRNFQDVVRLVDGYEIQDAINQAYSEVGKEETAIIVRSNKRANQYNQQ